MPQEIKHELQSSFPPVSKEFWWKASALVSVAMACITVSFFFAPEFFWTVLALMGGVFPPIFVLYVFGEKIKDKVVDRRAIKIQNESVLSSDDGRGRIAVIPEEHGPTGLVSLKDERRKGQVALAETKQNQAQ